jgi:hypothetical protein
MENVIKRQLGVRSLAITWGAIPVTANPRSKGNIFVHIGASLFFPTLNQIIFHFPKFLAFFCALWRKRRQNRIIMMLEVFFLSFEDTRHSK